MELCHKHKGAQPRVERRKQTVNRAEAQKSCAKRKK